MEEKDKVMENSYAIFQIKDILIFNAFCYD